MLISNNIVVMPARPIKINKKLLRNLSETDLLAIIEDLKNVHKGQDSACCNIDCKCDNWRWCPDFFKCADNNADLEADNNKISVIP